MPQDTSVQAVRTYVRSFVDVDSTDIPDSLCDSWTYNAWDDLIGTDIRWPFFEVGDNAQGSLTTPVGNPYQIKTVVGQQIYKMPAVTVQGVEATVDPHKIVAIQGPHWELLYDSQVALESTFTPAFIVSQEPERYSIWGNTGIVLWPIPNSVYTLNVRAYRNPIDWVGLGAGGLIDAPNDFFSALEMSVLSQAWAQQTDLQQASFWADQYQQAKGRLARKYLRSPLPENLVLNGGPVTRDLPPRLRYPFEGMSSVGLYR